jgi:hypothetical protein
MGAVELALQAIADANHGRIEPEAVVEAARDRESPLHDYFTWSNREAADKRRLDEARELIRSFKLVVVDRTVSFEIPKYIRDPAAGPREQGYVAVARLRGREDLSREAAVREIDRARAALTRALNLSHYLEIADQVQEALELVENISRRAQENRPGGHA